MNRKAFGQYWDLMKESRYFLLGYVLLVSAMFAGMLSPQNISHPQADIGFFVFIVAVGILLILYGFKNRGALHRVAFVYTIVIGVLIAFLAPPFSIPDEASHLTRICNILQGFIVPTADSSGYPVFFNQLLWHTKDLYAAGSLGFENLFFNNSFCFEPLSQVNATHADRITNTPFFTYIFSVAGVFMAKSLDLSVIWAIWLSRLPNLIVYALIVSYAIKKAPVYKMPLLVVSCTPLIATVMATSNYDSFIFGVLILAIAYFVRMYENGVRNRDLLAFFICCLLIGLIKPPYIVFSLLAFLIPRKNFEFANPRVKLLICVAAVVILAVGILKGFSMLSVSTSAVAVDTSNGSMGSKIAYLLRSPGRFSNILNQAVNFIPDKFVFNTFYYHEFWVGEFKGIQLFNVLYFIFFVLFSVLYPIKIKLSRNKRLALAVFSLLFYFGLFFALYIAWYQTGYNVDIKTQPRYYVPLFLLIPLYFNYPFKKIKNADYYAITAVMAFLAGIFLLTITHFY